jgi:UDP-N-acetylmuramoylalanine--D-glutamate ligase
MNLAHKKVLIVGFGKTGEALARFLVAQGCHVKVSEKKKEDELGKKVQSWKEQGVQFETGGHSLPSFLEADLIVPSPGVPPIPELEVAKGEGIPILSEVELAFQYLKGKIVGVTGSNGKSTTVALAHKILKEAGLRAYPAGNIGTPIISFVPKDNKDKIYVTEISSFQLEYTQKFKVPISAFLNISVNHLDWHASFDEYYETKKKLILYQHDEDAAILNRDDPLVWSLAKEAQSQVFGFSRRRAVSRGTFLQDGWIVLRNKDEKKLMPVSEIHLPGVHNQENVMAAALVGHLFDVSISRMRQSIKTFRGLEHRLEKVLTFRGVDFINDSKATTVDAALKALQSFDKKAILILGGRDKGDDFTRLRKAVSEKVLKVILIGEAMEKIKKSLKDTVPMESASSMREAVSLGYEASKPGEIILLAPACTSFDWFKNFEHRGHIFKKEVLRLVHRLRKEKA